MRNLDGGEVFFFDAHHPCFANEDGMGVLVFDFCGEVFPECM